MYKTPGLFTRILAFFTRVLPKSVHSAGWHIKLPTPQTEKMFEDSFDAAVNRDRQTFAGIKAGDLKIFESGSGYGKSGLAGRVPVDGHRPTTSC